MPSSRSPAPLGRAARRATLLLLGTTFLGASACGPPRPVDLSTVTTAQWRGDLHFMARELAKRHANVFHRVSRERYEHLVAAIDAALPGVPSPEVPVYLEKLTAAVGDAHTWVSLPEDERLYGFLTFRFGDDWRVIRVTPSHRDLLGARLVKIDDHEMSDVESRVREVLTQGENQWFYCSNLPWLLTREVLHAVGVVQRPDRATFTFVGEDGATFTRSLAPEPDPDVRPYTTPPLWLAHRTDDFWFTPIPASHAVYVVFNGYEHLASNAGRLFDYIDAHPHAVNRLVLDLRANGGGDYLEGHRDLVVPILKRPALNQRGHLYVITGRRTFSAAMNNAAQLRTETRAILVGEPPGETPNSYQEKATFFLPASHLAVNYSARYYKFLPDDAPAIVPDHEIDPDWESYRAGRDPALEWALSDGSR